MKVLSFEVPGIPIGKGAARHSRRGFTYTPTKTRNYMGEVKQFAVDAGAQPIDAPCSMVIKAHFPIPVSLSGKKQREIREGKLFFTKKPDTDNLSKIKDALNGVAFRDDSLVFKEEIYKFYSDRPRLEITIFYHQSLENNMLGYRA